MELTAGSCISSRLAIADLSMGISNTEIAHDELAVPVYRMRYVLLQGYECLHFQRSQNRPSSFQSGVYRLKRMEHSVQQLSRMKTSGAIRQHGSLLNTGPTIRRSQDQTGFSMIELAVVIIIFLIVAAAAVPTVMTSVRMARLRGASSDYAGLLEVARIYAVRDNRYYSTYILAPVGNAQVGFAYVDMLPKVLTGASGNGGTSVATGDPSITISSDIVQRAVGSAPNTANLKSQLLPATTPVTPTDAYATAPAFGPRGLPCTPTTLTGGTICDSSGGPTAFWTFLQNTTNSTWQAVTITPAGRIQKWYYTGSAWIKL